MREHTGWGNSLMCKVIQEWILWVMEPQTTHCTFIKWGVGGGVHIFSVDRRYLINYSVPNGNMLWTLTCWPGVNNSNHDGFLTCKVLKWAVVWAVSTQKGLVLWVKIIKVGSEVRNRSYLNGMAGPWGGRCWPRPFPMPHSFPCVRKTQLF